MPEMKLVSCQILRHTFGVFQLVMGDKMKDALKKLGFPQGMRMRLTNTLSSWSRKNEKAGTTTEPGEFMNHYLRCVP
jgi:hypothetical protein